MADVTQILASHGISIEALLQKEPNESESQVPVVLITHKVREEKVDAAIAELEALDSIHGEVMRIRMEPLD